MDLDRSREFGVRSGRIILLGDGTEVIPDQSEDEPFDQSEEEKEEPSTTTQEQVGSSNTTRNDREGTPGPQTKNENGTPSSANISESPASTATADRNNDDTSSDKEGQKSGSS